MAYVELAPAAKQQLADAEKVRLELEEQRGPIAHRAFGPSSTPEVRARAKADLDELLNQIAAATAHRDSMAAAYSFAVAEDERHLRDARASLAKSQLAAALSHISARDKAAEELAGHLDSAVRAYQTVLDRSAKAQGACPIGHQWPHESLCSAEELRRLVTYELYRVSQDASVGTPRAFPGATFPDLMYQHNPAAIPPMLDQIKSASAHVRQSLKGKIAV